MKRLIREGIKDEYGILRLQNVILNIMSYIDNICQKNDIEYYIIGGTALGAERHGGFIPWDDDLDIAMTRHNYEKFCKVFREQSDKNKYFFQESLVDWDGYYSKVRLLGTFIGELEYERNIPKEKRGIFIDIFPLDYVPNNKFMQCVWYLFGKALVANALLKRGYDNASFKKKCLMYMSVPLNIKLIHDWIYTFVLSYNEKGSNYLGGFTLISNFKNTISPYAIWGKPKYVPFESIRLLAPVDNDAFLHFYFGDYMKLPPLESRKSKHMTELDLGEHY